MPFRPRYITFDCYGTLTNFNMNTMAREMFADRIPADGMKQFLADFSIYRFDETLDTWRPYADLIRRALERACRKWGTTCTEAEARAYYDLVPTWGPHPDVPAGLAKIAKEFPLVILSNASDDQIGSNVAKLGAPFHRVYTAQQAQAYKPRLRAFEYMIDQLGCKPEEILHVSSSLRYDIMSAHDMGIRNRVFVNRGHGPGSSAYHTAEVAGIGGLSDVLGL